MNQDEPLVIKEQIDKAKEGIEFLREQIQNFYNESQELKSVQKWCDGQYETLRNFCEEENSKTKEWYAEALKNSEAWIDKSSKEILDLTFNCREYINKIETLLNGSVFEQFSDIKSEIFKMIDDYKSQEIDVRKSIDEASEKFRLFCYSETSQIEEKNKTIKSEILDSSNKLVSSANDFINTINSRIETLSQNAAEIVKKAENDVVTKFSAKIEEFENAINTLTDKMDKSLSKEDLLETTINNFSNTYEKDKQKSFDLLKSLSSNVITNHDDISKKQLESEKDRKSIISQLKLIKILLILIGISSVIVIGLLIGLMLR